MFNFVGNVFRNLTSRPATRPYPYKKRPPVAGSRGRLTIDPALCVYCGTCAKRCLTDAITITRRPDTWTIDPYRCIICGYCVEGCPKHCLSMKPEHGDYS
jgi:ech hydrogenase subunit F